MKGVAEQSSVFASEIFTVISPIPEEPPAVFHIIHINKMHEMHQSIDCIELKYAF